MLTTCGRNQVSRPFIGEKLERGTEIDVSQSRSEGRACWPQWAWDDEANLSATPGPTGCSKQAGGRLSHGPPGGGQHCLWRWGFSKVSAMEIQRTTGFALRPCETLDQKRKGESDSYSPRLRARQTAWPDSMGANGKVFPLGLKRNFCASPAEDGGRDDSSPGNSFTETLPV